MKKEKFLELTDDILVEHSTDEARTVIENTGTGSHVYEVWEDGEITSTKGGSVFRKRSLHQRVRPMFSDEHLWEVPEDSDHKSKVVIDKNRLKEIINEHTEHKMF